MRYRDKIEIISRILEVANGDDVTKTKIMYHAFLAHSQLKYYLTTLTDNDLLSYNFDTQTFITTEKGIRFLKTYNRIIEVMTNREEEQQRLVI